MLARAVMKVTSLLQLIGPNVQKNPPLCAWNKCQVRLRANERHEHESEKQIREHVRKSGVWELRPGIMESLNGRQFFKGGGTNISAQCSP